MAQPRGRSFRRTPPASPLARVGRQWHQVLLDQERSEAMPAPVAPGPYGPYGEMVALVLQSRNPAVSSRLDAAQSAGPALALALAPSSAAAAAAPARQMPAVSPRTSAAADDVLAHELFEANELCRQLAGRLASSELAERGQAELCRDLAEQGESELTVARLRLAREKCEKEELTIELVTARRGREDCEAELRVAVECHRSEMAAAAALAAESSEDAQLADAERSAREAHVQRLESQVACLGRELEDHDRQVARLVAAEADVGRLTRENLRMERLLSELAAGGLGSSAAAAAAAPLPAAADFGERVPCSPRPLSDSAAVSSE